MIGRDLMKLKPPPQVIANGVVARFAETNGVYSGIGDIAAVGSQVAKLPGPEIPDPGGLACCSPCGAHRLSRKLRSSASQARAPRRSSPRGKAVSSARDRRLQFWTRESTPDGSATGGFQGPHQFSWPPARDRGRTESHLLLDFIGQKIRNGGEVGIVSDPVPGNAGGISAVQSLVVLPEGILKGLLVPGIKVNLKGKLLLSLNAIVTMKNNGLHSRVTPVVGLNLTM